MMNTNNLEKITISINKELSKQLTNTLKLIRKTHNKPKMTRPEMVKMILIQYIAEMHSEKQSHEKIIELSNKFEKDGMEASMQCDQNKAKKLFLLSAAKEIEALAILDDPKELDIKSALIRAIILLKDGTGYSHLPDIPARKQKLVNTAIYNG